MHKRTVPAGIILIAAALIIIFLAWLIKYKKKVNLISGYDENTVKDKDGLANWVGGTLIIAGALALIPSTILLLNALPAGIAVIAYGVIILGGVIITIAGGKKFRI